MLIDWTTVIFQLVNFLILMALLKKFLFGRVTKAMDEREEEIAGRLERAEEKQNQADRLKDEYERKAAHIEQERRERLETAGREAEEKRKELIRQAREEVDLQKKRWRQSLDDERDSFLRRMRDLAATQVFEISRRVLADLADAELDERAAKVFTRRLSELSEEDRVALADGLKKADGRALVRSGFDLSSGAQGQNNRRRAPATRPGNRRGLRERP